MRASVIDNSKGSESQEVRLQLLPTRQLHRFCECRLLLQEHLCLFHHPPPAPPQYDKTAGWGRGGGGGRKHTNVWCCFSNSLPSFLPSFPSCRNAAAISTGSCREGGRQREKGQQRQRAAEERAAEIFSLSVNTLGKKSLCSPGSFFSVVYFMWRGQRSLWIQSEILRASENG